MLQYFQLFLQASHQLIQSPKPVLQSGGNITNDGGATVTSRGIAGVMTANNNI
jgi:hypothetical protein